MTPAVLALSALLAMPLPLGSSPVAQMKPEMPPSSEAESKVPGIAAVMPLCGCFMMRYLVGYCDDAAEAAEVLASRP
jgi:hypothetical protein